MNRPDFSEYVAHFTKDSATTASTVAGKKVPSSAYDRLVKILTDRRILASAMPWTNKAAVAFTECPFWSLLDHAKRYSPYGVGFTKAHLFAAGGGPAIYLRPNLHEKQQVFVHNQNANLKGFHPDLYPFVTPFIPDYASKHQKAKWGKNPVDYSHEREWRVPHDFTFQFRHVRFVIVETYADMAKFPKALKDGIGRDKFVILSMYEQIERLWPTHKI